MSDLFYLSFCDPGRPAGTQFLGACVVPAGTTAEAITAAHLLGCNPGGEVMAIGPIPEGEIGDVFVGRLLSAEEAKAVGPGPGLN